MVCRLLIHTSLKCMGAEGTRRSLGEIWLLRLIATLFLNINGGYVLTRSIDLKSWLVIVVVLQTAAHLVVNVQGLKHRSTTLYLSLSLCLSPLPFKLFSFVYRFVSSTNANNNNN